MPGTGRLSLDYVNQRDAASPRKFFLAGAACVRRVWHLLELSASREAVEAAEQFADGFISRVQLVAYTDAADVWEHWPQADPRFVARVPPSSYDMTHVRIMAAPNTRFPPSAMSRE